MNKARNFERRTDIYYEDSELAADLTERNGAGDTDAGREELIARVINLTKVSHFLDDVTVIVLAQTIKDTGDRGQMIVDWNRNGSESASASIDETGFFNAGYRRFNQSKKGTFVSSGDSAAKGISYLIQDCKTGRYDNGVDLITSEAKIRAAVYYDAV